MASSPPQIRASFQSYRDEPLPSSGSRPDSRADLESYFNANPPPPHRLSGFYPSATGSAASSTDALPHMREARGSYLTPAAANSATTTVGIGLQQQARNSEVSMIGLGQTVPLRKSTWLEKETKNQKRGRKLFITFCTILVLLIIAAIVLGVVFGTRAARKNSEAEGDSDSQNNSTGSTSTAGVVEQEDPNDPSTFAKDSRLKNSFYGIAYTQMDSLYPDCNQGLAATIEDIQLISQLTNRIRLYGADCNQTALVLEAIKQTKVDMKIFAAIYILPDDEPSYQRQRNAVRQALEDYGSDNIEGITVGNEFMLNYIVEHGGTSPESAVGLEASALLREKIQDVRDMLTGMDIDLPVGTSDAGAYFNTDLLEAVDFGLSNIHAWFASTSVETSAQWTFDFFETNNVEPAALLSNRPTMYIAETGWPTHSSDAEHENNGASDASVANLQTFMDDFVCQANRDNVNYFFFEYSDVPWKDTRFGGVEGFWGLFDENKKLKDITIPDCAHR